VNAPMNLATLKAMWQTHKKAENDAKAMRLEVETAILSHFPSDKLEGAETDKDVGITVTYKVTRKVDTPALQAIWETLGKNAQAAFKWSADVDTKTYKALADLDQKSFSLINAFITTTPNKASITIKE
jgi:hypothetical protein